MQHVEFSFNEVLIRQANRLRRIERDYNEEFLGYKQRIQSLNISEDLKLRHIKEGHKILSNIIVAESRQLSTFIAGASKFSDTKFNHSKATDLNIVLEDYIKNIVSQADIRNNSKDSVENVFYDDGDIFIGFIENLQGDRVAIGFIESLSKNILRSCGFKYDIFFRVWHISLEDFERNKAKLNRFFKYDITDSYKQAKERLQQDNTQVKQILNLLANKKILNAYKKMFKQKHGLAVTINDIKRVKKTEKYANEILKGLKELESKFPSWKK